MQKIKTIKRPWTGQLKRLIYACRLFIHHLPAVVSSVVRMMAMLVVVPVRLRAA